MFSIGDTIDTECLVIYSEQLIINDVFYYAIIQRFVNSNGLHHMLVTYKCIFSCDKKISKKEIGEHLRGSTNHSSRVLRHNKTSFDSDIIKEWIPYIEKVFTKLKLLEV
jgi:hypothetical protein